MKTKTRSFQFKLWIYFALFSAFIFLVLWLLQIVFLRGFYNGMIIRNTNKVLDSVVACKNDEEINDAISRYALDNTVLIHICDAEGNQLNKGDPFSQSISKGRKDQEPKDFPGRRDPDDNRDDRFPGGEGFPGDGEGFRGDGEGFPGNWQGTRIPPMYEEYLEKFTASGEDTIECRSDDFYFCASYISYQGNDKAILLVSATLNAVGSAVKIIRVQLLWGILISLVIGFILSWFLAHRFSGPVDRLSDKARKLGDRDYSEDYPRGFCTELDELSGTLDRTNEKLIISRNFQTELMANVSHDLRTPLTMIKGYAEMINDISFDDREQCRNDMQVIIKEADRLTALVNEILAYSELQTEDKLEYSTDVDLSKLLHSAVESFSTLCKPDGITVESDIAEGVIVDGSRSHLERVLYNLCENAVRHTGDSKTIRVALTEVNGEATISVTDYGAGIPAEELEHIWERYYTSRMRKGQGVSGLGLAIVKQIVTIHGGRCLVQSEEGKGSTFSVVLRTLPNS